MAPLNNRTLRILVVVLVGLTLMAAACNRGEPVGTVSPTVAATDLEPISTTTLEGQVRPSQTPTGVPEGTRPVTNPYPAPTLEPPPTEASFLEPEITPTATSTSAATAVAVQTETATSLSPPYPGGPTSTPFLPPYPVTQRPSPTATQEQGDPTATSSQAGSPTPSPLPEGTPSITPTPAQTSTITPTPTVTVSPTVTTTPRPRIDAQTVEVDCLEDDGAARCEDPIIERIIALPSVWLQGITGQLLPGETGVQYHYELQRSPGAQPDLLEFGGLSQDFADDRERLLTDFSGFQADTLAERCAQLQDARVCEDLSPEVMLSFLFPEAGAFCRDNTPLLTHPLVLVGHTTSLRLLLLDFCYRLQCCLRMMRDRCLPLPFLNFGQLSFYLGYRLNAPVDGTRHSRQYHLQQRVAFSTACPDIESWMVDLLTWENSSSRKHEEHNLAQ